MFYFDNTLQELEAEHSWDKALIYLEDLFVVKNDITILYLTEANYG